MSVQATSAYRQKQTIRLPAVTARRSATILAVMLLASTGSATPAFADECQPAGQTTCPTNSCFFWVNGVFGGRDNADPSVHFRQIGSAPNAYQAGQMLNPATGLPINTGWPAGSNIVGAGEYADSYGPNAAQTAAVPADAGPFYRAANGSFDSIAIGANTRVIIYQGLNFSGPVLFDQKGPIVVNNVNSAGVNAGTTWKSQDWSTAGPLLSQFTPDKRFNSNESPINLSPGNGGMWVLSGAPTTVPTGKGPTSVKVICDPAPSPESCLSPPTTCPPPPPGNNGVCGTTPGTCASGSVSADDGNTTCEQTRTWICEGDNGGVDANCSATNDACSPPPPPPPPVENGSCGTTPGTCAIGAIANDNAANSCGVSRQWDCLGSNGGTTANCSTANPSCTCVTGDIQLTMPGKIISTDTQGTLSWTSSFGAGIAHDNEPCQVRATVTANGETQTIHAAGVFAPGSTSCSATTTMPVGGVATTAKVDVSYDPATGEARGQASVDPYCESPPPPKNCVSPWGTTVVHGGSIVAFENATESCGDSCKSETRTCVDGVLSGSYTQQSCSIAACPPPPTCSGTVTWSMDGYTCTADGGTVPIGGGVTVRDRVYGAAPDGQGVAEFGCDMAGNWVFRSGTCVGGQACTPPQPPECPN